MKRLIKLLLLVQIPVLACCEKMDESQFFIDESHQVKKMQNSELPQVEIAIKDLTPSQVTFEATIKDLTEQTISRRGFLYSTVNAEPTIGATGVTNRLSTAKTDTYSYTLKTLKIDNTYYVRSYIICDSKDTIYSPVASFSTAAKSPVVQTLPVFNRVKRAAIVCGQFIESGDLLLSYGICISEQPNPTIKDTHVEAPDTATDGNYRGKFGVFFDNLKENTLYHVRAYAINEKDTVYGDNRIFKTSQGGSFNWQFNNIEGAKADGAYERILTHVDSAMYYYRNYTNLNKYLWVNYSPGTPTADCNIEGWMRVGENARYQWVGTIQHEMCHALGVGTASNWNSFGSPWDKEQATLTLRVMMKDMSVNLYHDGMHFWPGGINQQEEVTQGTANNKGTYTLKGHLMLKANAMVINAMRNDGLTTY